jgi:fructose-6-phosphate aldolase 2
MKIIFGKSKSPSKEMSMVGSHAATVSHEILERLRSHPMTDMSLEWFVRDGKHLYDVEF